MRILVTGGAGFIGSNFVIRSLQTRKGISITVLDALTYAGDLANLKEVLDEITFIEGNILDSQVVYELVSQADLVVHFAAESHNDNSLVNPKIFYESNVMGTLNLVQAAAKFDVRFHHISTDEVYGDLPLNSSDKFTTDSPYRPSSPYSASKASSDMIVRSWVRSFGLKATLSNCSNNFGPRQHPEKLIPRSIVLAASGIRPKIYGSGSNVRDWIHVDDHNDGVWAVIDRGRVGETYLLGANCERTNLEVVRAILRTLNLEPDFIQWVDDRPGHDLRYAIDPSKANNELGWSALVPPIEESLQPVVDYYLEKLNNEEIDLSALRKPNP